MNDLFPTLYKEFMERGHCRIKEDDEATPSGEAVAESGWQSAAACQHLSTGSNTASTPLCAEPRLATTKRALPESDIDPPVTADDLLEENEAAIAAAPRDDAEKAAQKEVEEVLNQDRDLEAAVGPAGPAMLRRMIMVRRCTRECEAMTAETALWLQRMILEYVKNVSLGQYELAEKFTRSRGPLAICPFDVLKQYEPCYAGLRSLHSRINAVCACLRALVVAGAARFEAKDLAELTSVVDRCKAYPKAIRDKIETAILRTSAESREHHSQSETLEQHGEKIQGFLKKIGDLEVYLCSVCRKYRSLKELQKTTAADIGDFIDPNATEPMFCRACVRETKTTNPIPRFSLTNNVKADDVPECLKQLNWIEKALIQRVRPIRSTIHMKNIGGKKTGMKGARGAMVMLPVPTEGTVDHVVKTLPSDVGLTILVESEVEAKRLVCLPRVLKALRWLKKCNPLYADVEINEAFIFSDGCVSFQRGAETDEEVPDLVATDAQDPTLLLHDEIDPRVVQDVGGKGVAGTAYERYLLQPNPYDVIPIDTENVDALAFPWHFPRGTFGFYQRRAKQVEKRQLVRWELQTEDRRFAIDAAYIAFVHGLFEQSDLLSSLGIRARLAKSAYDPDRFEELLADATDDQQIAFSTAARQLRGHAAYWEECRKELRAHVAVFGPPTWFLTLNPAERDWKEVLETYQKVYGKEVTKDNIREFIERDPFFFCRHFQSRFRAMLSEVLCPKDEQGGPLGRVQHYYTRIEYQQRGTEHIHGLLWCSDAPALSSSDDEKIEYIAEKVTARLPDKKLEPELHKLVMEHQQHWSYHSATCKRTIKVNGQLKTVCRFGMPRRVLARPRMTEDVQKMLLGVPGARVKGYELQREEGVEEWLNEYNPAVLLAWQANIDVQFVATTTEEVVNYVTGYASKHESSKEGGGARESLASAHTSTEGFKALVDLLRKREVGMPEMIDTLMGHNLRLFDSSHVFIPTDDVDHRHRMLKKKEDRGDGPMYLENMADTYYPGRDNRLENASYFSVMIQFEAAKIGGGGPGQRSTDEDEDAPLGQQTNPFLGRYHVRCPRSPFYNWESLSADQRPLLIAGCAPAKQHRRLGKPKVPRLYYPTLDPASEESREDFYRRLVMLMIPWRDEEKMLETPGCVYESYEKRWVAYLEHLQSSGDADDATAYTDIMLLLSYHEQLARSTREMYERRQEQRKLMQCAGVDVDVEDAGELQVFDRLVDTDRHAQDISNLNAEQTSVYEKVLDAIESQEAVKTEIKRLEDDRTLSALEKKKNVESLRRQLEPLKIFVSGTAGTGKSFLINTLADELTERFANDGSRSQRPGVLIAAPTGLAAIQIKGSTLHSLLKMGVQHGREPIMPPLSADQVTSLRHQFSRVRLLIIDEVSMVSNVMLAKIHSRLQEIMHSDAIFGGCNLLLFGDLLQLMPVSGSPIFDALLGQQVARFFGGCAPTLNLFSGFAYVELTQNMRQKDDLEYAEVMGRLRTQQLTEADTKFLKTRLIDGSSSESTESETKAAAKFYAELMKTDPRAMALFGTVVEVDMFNDAVMEELGLSVVEIKAEDSVQRNRTNRRAGGDEPVERIYQRAEYDLTRAADKPPRKAKRRAHKELDARRAGGLVETLRVAVGGRVMLRRNINASCGLVNGATGVLTEIVTLGSTEPDRLIVQFDAQPSPTTIEKVSAVFETGLNQRMSRRQFPLATSFAATVHKAQGMTLDSALIGTSSFFAAGQAYVALSRVRNVQGLHLVDLHEDRLFASRAAIKAYNRLRKSIGAVEIPLPTTRTAARSKTRDWKKTPGSASANASAVLVVGQATPKPSGKKPVSRPRFRSPSSSTTRSPPRKVVAPSTSRGTGTAVVAGRQSAEVLMLPNPDSTHCFVNTPVNLLYSMEQLRFSLTNVADDAVDAVLDHAAARELRRIFSGAATDTLRLRPRVPGYGAGEPEEAREGDAAEFLCKLMDTLPEEFQAMMRFSVQTTYTCRGGHVTVRDTNDVKTLDILSALVPLPGEPSSFEQLFLGQRLNEHPTCAHCHQPNSASMRITQSQSYCIVVLHQYLIEVGRPRRRKIPLKIREKNLANFKLGGVSWKLAAGIEYISSGHYKLWKRNADGKTWTLYNDRPLEARQQQRVKAGLEDFYVCLLVKI